MPNFKRIAELKRRVVKAQHAMSDFMAKEFPEGSTVRWDHGGHSQTGTVVGTADRHGLRAQNWHTGKTVNVSVYSIMQEAGVKLPSIWQ